MIVEQIRIVNNTSFIEHSAYKRVYCTALAKISCLKLRLNDKFFHPVEIENILDKEWYRFIEFRIKFKLFQNWVRFVNQYKLKTTRDRRRLVWRRVRSLLLLNGSCSWCSPRFFRRLAITGNALGRPVASGRSLMTAAASNAFAGSRSLLAGELMNATVFSAACLHASSPWDVIGLYITEMSWVSTRSVVSWQSSLPPNWSDRFFRTVKMASSRLRSWGGWTLAVKLIISLAAVSSRMLTVVPEIIKHVEVERNCYWETRAHARTSTNSNRHSGQT